jgi:cephalosporin hydroxylase
MLYHHSPSVAENPIAIRKRDEIGKLLNALGYARGVEVGVQYGKYSRIILSTWGGHLTMVDAWREFPKDQYVDLANVSETEHLRNMAWAVENVQAYMGRYEIVRALSTDAAARHGDRSLDFVYLDADHSYEGVMKDLEAWRPKVRPGGMLCGHDYLDAVIEEGNFGVKTAVNKFFGCPPDIVTEEYWASWFKIL